MSTQIRRSPLVAIRAFCVECQGGSPNAVTECNDTACAFHPYRHGAALEKGRHSPVRACKAYCFENCLPGAAPNEVSDCLGDKALLGPCPVFPFRMGRNPNISEATREKCREEASKRVVKGKFGFCKTIVHTPFDDPEPTKMAEATP